jgi:hypothetical protein
MNSPDQVTHRLINSDYFEFISEYDMKLWLPIIQKHISNCEICIEKHQDKNDLDKIVGFLDDFKSIMGSMVKDSPLSSGLDLFNESVDQVKDELDKVVIKKDDKKIEELNGIGKIIGMLNL